MQCFKNEQEYNEYMYRRKLRKTSVGLGVLLVIFFAAEMIIGTILGVVLYLTGTVGLLKSGSAMEMLLSGFISSTVFFFISFIYCLITKKSFARLFPFDKIEGGYAVMLCGAGLAFCLMGNIASEWLTGIFGLVGLNNNGGQILEEGALPSVFLYYLTVTVMPALFEEFAFRGVVMGSLRPYSEGLALIVSSAMFALLHGNFVQIPFAFCGGLVFGFVVLKTNSLLPGIIIHFLNNALSVTADVLSSYKIVPDNIINMAYGVIFIVSGILAFIFVRRILKNKPETFTLAGADDVIPYRLKMRTVCTTPTLIVFSAIMILYATADLLLF